MIPFRISRWIFAGCIILTWVLLAYRLQRAIRAIKSGVVTKCYLDPLAVRIQSIHVGQGRGWRRFLVFAALTKGRKGAEYVALFSYFTFEGISILIVPASAFTDGSQAWLRICFAEGPRQVINALTLYSVLKAQLIPVGAHKPDHGHTPVVQFFVNIRILANENKEQAAILFGMLYTLIIWIFSALSLILAFLSYVLFLWHHIPSADGTLSRYCRRKIEKRLHKIVMEKVNKALAKEDKKRAQQDLAKPGIAGIATSDVKRQPTLPVLGDEVGTESFRSSSQQSLHSSFAPFEPRPASRNDSVHSQAFSREPTLPSLAGPGRPGLPSRQTTQSSFRSEASYDSDAPLMSQAAEMGYGGPGGPRNQSRNGPVRMDSESTMRSQRAPPLRAFSPLSQDAPRSQSPRMGPPRRHNTDNSIMTSSTGHPPRSQSRTAMSREHSYASTTRSPLGPPPPGPFRRPTQEYEMQPPTPSSTMSNRGPPAPGPSEFTPYKPYNPNGPTPPPEPVRNFTMPYTGGPPRDYFGSSANQPPRSGTAPIPQSSDYNVPTEGTRGGPGGPHPNMNMPQRPATAGSRPVQQGAPYRAWNPPPARQW